MENFDYDLQSVQEARNLARLGKIATDKLADYTEEQIEQNSAEHGSCRRGKRCDAGKDGS